MISLDPEKTAEEIAGKLTKRQRLDLRRYVRGSMPCRTSMKYFIADGLIGFTDEAGIRCDNLSSLGLQVAALLSKKMES